jgi:hypothetical protein
MNDRLLMSFTQDEVKYALFQSHPLKAFEPNGMTVLFF